MARMEQLPTTQNVIEYLGYRYEILPSAPYNPPDTEYSTGERFEGLKIYMPVWYRSPIQKIPTFVLGKKQDGTFQWYTLKDKLSVYAYMLNGTYNKHDSINFGLYNDSNRDQMMINTSPWIIQQKLSDGRWKKFYDRIYIPDPVPLSNRDYKEFSWNQKADGNIADNGEYRVKFEPLVGENENRYAYYKVKHNTPSLLDQQDKNYSIKTADEEFLRTNTQLFNWDLKYSRSIRDELISQMLCKAYVKGFDPISLESSIKVTGSYMENLKELPCIAVYTKLENKPVWSIVYGHQIGFRIGFIPHYYIIDDKTHKIIHENGTIPEPNP